MSYEETRQELIRSRGFIRGAETQLSKALAALDGTQDDPPEEPGEPEPTVSPPTNVSAEVAS